MIAILRPPRTEKNSQHRKSAALRQPPTQNRRDRASDLTTERPDRRETRSPANASTAEERAILRSRAAALLKHPIEFIDQAEYATESTRQVLVDAEQTPLPDTSAPTSHGKSRGVTSMASYLDRLYESRLLTPDEEREVFRRMNLLKHHAHVLSESLSPVRPSAALVDRIERLLGYARHARDLLISSNLRLVVSIAKKFAGEDSTVDDLVSEGHLALFRAVEKFNHARGFRFSTYATHAIRRQLHRAVMKKQRDRRRGLEDTADVLPSIAAPEFEQTAAPSAAAHTAVERAILRLDPRERMIVHARFGINSGGESKTLIELAGELGVCKERVRQLEIRALKKLRLAIERENITAETLEG